MDNGKCPKCGLTFEAFTNLATTRGPRAGDYTVCVSCGMITVFDERLQQRELTRQESGNVPRSLLEAQLTIMRHRLGREE